MAKPEESTSEDSTSKNSDNKSTQLAGDTAVSSHTYTDDTVSVYNTIANNNSRKIATGFCNAFGGTKPKDSLVNPLKPTSARTGSIPSQSKADRMHDLGMTFQLVLSDIWGYDDNHIPGENDDWTEYENMITEAVNDTLSLNHMNIGNTWFEIWNEPNGTFWPYSGQYSYDNHFMDTWEHAYSTIKAINPNAKVIGPSFSGFYWEETQKDQKLNKTDGIKGFLNEAQSRGVLSDYVSWHYPFSGLTDQVEKVNTFSNNNYMNFDGIIIGEYLTPNQRKNGSAAYAIAQMERTSINPTNDVVVEAAGLDPEIAQNGVLDGLAQFADDPDNLHAGGDLRGSWWVYKKYADMDGIQTLKTIKGLEVEVHATTIPEPDDVKMKILLGTYGDTFEGSAGVNIYDLQPNYHYNYNIYRLKDEGDDKVGQPQSVYGNVKAADSQGELYIEVDWQDPTDCYFILLLG